MVLTLVLLSGLAWTLVYVEAIRVGFRQRTYAMPAAALALNIAWEWMYAAVGLAGEPDVQTWVNVVWGLADVLLVVTFVRFGYAEFSAVVTRSAFVIGAVGLLAVAIATQIAFFVQFGRDAGATYSAFLQNLLMSGLFVAMYVARRGGRGQNLLIATAKWIGTLCPTVQWGILAGSAFVTTIGGLCCVVDVAYIALLARARRERGVGSLLRGRAPH